MNTQRIATSITLLFTLMLAGRAMTLAWIGQAGSGVPGAPPAAWLMPLVGDAVIGIGALLALFLLIRGRGLASWTVLVLWNALGIWDAISAFLIHTTTPWPDFFMVQIFGWSMFVAASAMHAVNLGLIAGPLRSVLLGGTLVPCEEPSALSV